MISERQQKAKYYDKNATGVLRGVLRGLLMKFGAVEMIFCGGKGFCKMQIFNLKMTFLGTDFGRKAKYQRTKWPFKPD